MQIVLAPMEGLADDIMRGVLTRVADVDWCVTEFARVTDTLLPLKFFQRICPELLNGARTASGVPVRLQLLGADPVCMAENAARAAEAGAPVIDLNFGCPAPAVNRHRGGAILLKEPELLWRICEAVRRAVPINIPVTAKMRLGYEDKSLAVACAQALAEGGAEQLVVHARTKIEAYRPPAHWSWIARVAQAVSVPVIANGEIWTVDDYWRCRRESGISDVMLGRGLIARPDLAGQIRHSVDGGEHHAMTWLQMLPLVQDYFAQVCARLAPKHAPGRLKLWLRHLSGPYPEAMALLQLIREEKNTEHIRERLTLAGVL